MTIATLGSILFTDSNFVTLYHAKNYRRAPGFFEMVSKLEGTEFIQKSDSWRFDISKLAELKKYCLETWGIADEPVSTFDMEITVDVVSTKGVIWKYGRFIGERVGRTIFTADGPDIHANLVSKFTRILRDVPIYFLERARLDRNAKILSTISVPIAVRTVLAAAESLNTEEIRTLISVLNLRVNRHG